MRQFNTAEIALWLVLNTLAVLQSLFDMGFSITFSRSISYAVGGANPDGSGAGKVEIGAFVARIPNWEALGKILGTKNIVYAVLASIWIVGAGIGGSFAVSPLVAATDSPLHAWLALAVVVGSTGIRLYANTYVVRLLGFNQVALLRRWETLIHGCVLLLSILALSLNAGFLEVICVLYGMSLFSLLAIRWQAARIVPMGNLTSCHFDGKTFAELWPSVWRSGLGVLLVAGVTQVSGIIYARLAPPADAASYILALNMLYAIAQFSQAPFYSKLPLLARLYAEGRLREQVKVAERGMRWSYIIYAMAILLVGVLAQWLLERVHANASFVGNNLWAMMGLAMFFERVGAMHLQLYTTTNHVIWHIANGVTGVIYILGILLIYPLAGVMAFPLAHLIGNLSFYSWYSAVHSYKAFRLPLLTYEPRTSLGPVLALIGYLAVTHALSP